jgi:hypothetical protein
MSDSDLGCRSLEIIDARSNISTLANIVHGSVSNENIEDILKEQKDSLIKEMR